MIDLQIDELPDEQASIGGLERNQCDS